MGRVLTLIVSPVLDIYGCLITPPNLVLKTIVLYFNCLMVPRVDWQFLLEAFSCNLEWLE